MRFENPEMLWVLAAVMPLLVLFLCYAWRKRRRLILQFVQSRLLAHLTVGVSTTRQKFRMVLVAVALLFTLLALARPQLGFDWEEARQRGRPFDAVILDLTVRGGMGGAATIERLHELDSDVCAIVASGYSDDPVMADHEGYLFRAALSKPFSRSDLAHALERVLQPRREV